MARSAFLFWRWQVRRRSLGFESYIDEVTRIEKRGLELELRARALLPRSAAGAEAKSGDARTSGGQTRVGSAEDPRHGPCSGPWPCND